jgi:dTDP-4-dehydrorhamnose reductase
MQQRSIVVTGATGLVGTKVVQKLLDSNDNVYAVVRKQPPGGYPGTRTPTPDTTNGVVLHTVDLAAARPDWTWMQDLRPAAVIHCAAMTNVDECERDPSSAYAINERATRSLAGVCSRYGTHLVLVSTDYVFDGSDEHPGPYNENDPVHPLNHYGRSKLHAEIAVQNICEGRAAWSICRTAVVYGSTAWTRANFLTWLLAKLRKREAVKIVCDQVSSPTLADDLAEMLLEIVRQQTVGIFHTAGRTILDRYQFALALAKQFDADTSLIRPITTSELQQVAPRPLKAGLCIDKIKQQLSLRPLSLAEGLLRLKEELREDPVVQIK